MFLKVDTLIHGTQWVNMLALLAHVVSKGSTGITEMKQTPPAHHAVQIQKGKKKMLMNVVI